MPSRRRVGARPRRINGGVRWFGVELRSRRSQRSRRHGRFGRRYRRMDEAGTPFCVTVDFETLGEKGPELRDTVTVRYRDDGRQERLPIRELPAWLRARIQ